MLCSIIQNTFSFAFFPFILQMKRSHCLAQVSYNENVRIAISLIIFSFQNRELFQFLKVAVEDSF